MLAPPTQPARAALRADAVSHRYTDAVERHFRASVLDTLPPQYDSLLQQIDDAAGEASYDMSAHACARGCESFSHAAHVVASCSPRAEPRWPRVLPREGGQRTHRNRRVRMRRCRRACRWATDARAGRADRDQNVDLTADDLLIIRYRPIRALLDDESVQLV